MEYRILGKEEISLLREIDRREIIKGIYYYRVGKLVLEDEYYDMKGFPPGELEQLVDRQHLLYNQGGTIIGAFEGPRITGMAAVENRFRGKEKRYLKMDILFVSYGYRKLGIGTKLVELVKERAKEMGAKKLYISSIPSRNTVNFYLNIGCQLCTELDLELFALEPQDIHLELDCS